MDQNLENADTTPSRLLEKTYEVCLAAELRHRGLRVERQVPVRLIYRDVELEVGYRIDILVENKVVVELTRGYSSTTAWTRWLQAGSSAWSGVAQ